MYKCDDLIWASAINATFTCLGPTYESVTTYDTQSCYNDTIDLRLNDEKREGTLNISKQKLKCNAFFF